MKRVKMWLEHVLQDRRSMASSCADFILEGTRWMEMGFLPKVALDAAPMCARALPSRSSIPS